MARALECPACGARHRLDALPEGPTFRCSNCGQVLKVPAWVSSSPGAPPPPARPSGSTPVTSSSSSASATAAAAAGAPATARREEATRTGDATRTDSPADAEVPPAPRGNRPVPGRSVAGVSATVAATESADQRGSRKGAPAPATPRAKRTKVAWYWRLVAWIVAVPLGFVLTAWPAYELGFIRKDDLLDIFVGTGVGRYARIAIVTLVWALVTALLVQLLVEGGRVRANRRRRARAVTA